MRAGRVKLFNLPRTTGAFRLLGAKLMFHFSHCTLGSQKTRITCQIHSDMLHLVDVFCSFQKAFDNGFFMYDLEKKYCSNNCGCKPVFSNISTFFNKWQ